MLLTTTKALHSIRISLGLLLVALVCCGGLTLEARADSLVIDPVGDTFGSGPVQLDITSVGAAYSNTTLTFTVNFAGEVFAPSTGDANSVFGFIEIDADRDAATGVDSLTGLLSPPPVPELGVEYSLNLNGELDAPGFVDVFNVITAETVGAAPITFSANAFTISVPLALLGGNGLVNYAAVFGTFDEPTDRAPNGATAATSAPVPEPATMLLLGTGLAASALARRRRRK